MVDRLWTPNVCFVNSKKTEIHSSPTPNIFLMLYPNGTVWINYRLQVQSPCIVDLMLFPMDIVHIQYSNSYIIRTPQQTAALKSAHGSTLVRNSVYLTKKLAQSLKNHFGEQTCELVIESYSYNAAKVGLHWREWNPVGFPRVLVFSIAKSKLADFTLYGLQWTKNSFEYAAGQWDQLTVSLTFSRAY
ncbi:unnamed protein product, partial [Strongylus vulgaris]